ncbi:MAG: hypothetical protein ACFFDF_23215 [Candidatus Odinarchaeota archaeon]
MVAVNKIVLNCNDLDVTIGYIFFFFKYNKGKNKIILEVIKGIVKT